MTSVRIGVIGAGSIAQGHARAIGETTGEIVAIADIDAVTRRSFASEFDVPGTYEDYETMLDEASLDAVLVSVPNHLHAPCTIAALERNVDVLVEKPLARTLDEARTIEQAADASGATVMTGFTMTFRDDVAAVRRWDSADEFGEIYDIDLTYVRRRGIPQLGSWFTRKDIAGGGALVDLGVHLLSVAMDLLDYPEITTVSATTDAHFGSDPEDYTYVSMWGGDPVDNPVFDVDDTVKAFLRTTAGTTIALDVAWASNRSPAQELQVLGTEAGATIDISGEQSTIFSTVHGDLTETELTLAETNPFVTEWEYFLEVITGEREHTRCTVEHGVTIQRSLEAIHRSNEQESEIQLAEG